MARGSDAWQPLDTQRLREAPRQEPERVLYAPATQKLFKVQLVEVPRPPESCTPAPVYLQAAGPIDAAINAGPLFNDVLARRKTRPIACLRVFEPNDDGASHFDVPWVAMRLFKPHEAPLRTDTDEAEE